MEYITGLSLLLMILIKDVLLCDVQSVMQCFEGFDFTAANLCLEVKKFEDCVAPFADICRDNAAYNTYVNQLKIFKPSCEGSSDASCDVMGLQKCMAEVEYAEGADLRDNCAFYPRFQECTQPLIAQCDDSDPQYMNIKNSIDNFRRVCASSDLSFAQCDLQAVMKCFGSLSQAQPGSDLAASCSEYEKVKACVAPHMENCASDGSFVNSMASLSSMESICAGGAQCNIQKCYEDAGIDTSSNSNAEPNCEVFQKLQTCINSLSTVCEGNSVYDTAKGSLQGKAAICGGVGNTGDSTCNFGKCITTESGTTMDPSQQSNCTVVPKVEQCLNQFQEECSNNTLFQSMRKAIQSSVENCKKVCNYMECNMDFTFPNGIPSKSEYVTGCSDIEKAIVCMEAKFKLCPPNKPIESSTKGMKAFCMDASLKSGLETHKDCLANSTINKDCQMHLTPPMEAGGEETEAQECMRIEKYAMCAKKGVSSCDMEGIQMFAAETARKVITLKSSREGGIECTTSAGVQAFPSLLLILVAAMLTFVKAF